jgi:Tol biopolymer transport system component/DNA-binding winged helix-turn-helix (wHTH) protein
MNGQNKQLYEFGPFRLDPAEHLLLRDGSPVTLRPKVFDILLVLVRNCGRLVTKDELLQAVWPDSFVEEGNLNKNVSMLRQALGENPVSPQYIETVPKYGYRFTADIREAGRADDDLLLIRQRTSTRIVTEEETLEVAEETVAAPATAPNGVSAVRVTSAARRRKMRVALALALLLPALFLARWAFFGGRQPAFNLANIKRLTANGNSSWPAISPDGKYVAYVLREAPDRLSIQLLHVETGGVQQIFAPAEYRDLVLLKFSPDGNFIYFAQSETYGPGPVRGLYRMSPLGGVPTRLLTDLGHYAISPDGARLAFVRNSRGTDESYLMIANADGTGEYRLAMRKLTQPFQSLHWSPGGKTIAAAVGSAEVSGQRMYPVEVSVADGTERDITAFRWNFLGSVLCLADGGGFIVSGVEATTTARSGFVWHIAPDGEVQKLTDDAIVYGMAGQTADSQTLIAQSVELSTNIWVAPLANPAAQARQITTGNDGSYVTYLPDGRLLFTSANNLSQADIWTMNADGSGRRQLTANAGTNTVPVASRDGRYIVFESDRAGKINVWRMGADGGNPKQLTFGDNEKSPDISPDGQWVVYMSADDSTLWRVPMGGGAAQKLTGAGWRVSQISPDGKWILSSYREPKPDAQRKPGLIPFDGGKPVKMFELPSDIQWSLYYRWTPDGQAFIFVGVREGVWNVWKQPIEGGPPVQLTDFKSTDQIGSPNFSPDGRQLVFSRGGWTFDVFLIRDFR